MLLRFGVPCFSRSARGIITFEIDVGAFTGPDDDNTAWRCVSYSAYLRGSPPPVGVVRVAFGQKGRFISYPFFVGFQFRFAFAIHPCRIDGGLCWRS